MATATIGGVELAYSDVGSGTPLVFIHGYPLNRSMWQDQAAGLSGEARVITIDLRGHGESQAIFWLSSVDVYAQHVNELLGSLGIDKAVICGFSMGGYVAFSMWRQFPERFKALILADTRSLPDSPEAKAGRYAAAITAQTKGAPAIADALIPRLLCAKTQADEPDIVARTRALVESTSIPGIVGDLMSMAERPDSTPDLASINVPTLVLVGSEDQLTPMADAEMMAKGIAGAKLEVIPDAAHMSPVENPEVFNQKVSEFLKTLS